MCSWPVNGKTCLLFKDHRFRSIRKFRLHWRSASGIAYSSFNSSAEYEHDPRPTRFELLPYVVTEDFTGLHQQCLLFDQHLWQFFKEHSVTLNTFAKMDELQNFLRTPRA